MGLLSLDHTQLGLCLALGMSNLAIMLALQRDGKDLSAHFIGTCREKVCPARVVAAVLPIPGASM